LANESFVLSVTGLEGEFESLIADSLSTKSTAIYEKCFDDYSTFCEEMSLPIAGGQSKFSVELWVAQHYWSRRVWDMGQCNPTCQHSVTCLDARALGSPGNLRS
jgi:hypothetical protein